LPTVLLGDFKMRKGLISSLFPLLLVPLIGCSTNNGLISIESSQGSVEEVANRFESILNKKGLKLFNRINHADGAKAANLKLNPTELLLFGNPKVGTPLMQCQQTTGIDLPQKALIWENYKGQVWITYTDPQYLANRHGISEPCAEVITKVGKALNAIANAAAVP